MRSRPIRRCGTTPRSLSLKTRVAATTTPDTFSLWTFSATAPVYHSLLFLRFATGGVINHNYADHVSILKFIEANWAIPPVSARSRDNFPNPIASAASPYVPTNSPAIDDLMGIFNFPPE